MSHDDQQPTDHRCNAHSVSVAGVVVNSDGQVLVIQRADTGDWQPPGGILDADETFEDGVVREVYEETGVLVEVEHLTGVYKNTARQIVALVYRCHPVGGAPRTSTEATAVQWLDPDQVEHVMAPAFAIRVLDALDGQVHSRHHDGVALSSSSSRH